MFYRCLNDDTNTALFVSSGCETITQCPKEVLMEYGIALFHSSIHPDDKEVFADNYIPVLGLHKTSVTEFRIIRPDKTTIWVRETANGIVDKDGVLEFIEGYVQDITSEKNAAKVASQFRSYENAINTGSIVSITDLSGSICFANDLFCFYSQYTREELIGQNHRIINSGYHDRSFFAALWKTISSGNIWRGEIKNKAKDGSFYWVDTVIAPIFNEDGQLYRFLSIRNIITEKKQAEVKLEQKYREIHHATKINECLLQGGTIQQIATVVLDALNNIMPIGLFRIYFYNSELNQLQLAQQSVPAQKIPDILKPISEAPLSVQSPFLQQVVQTGQPIISSDLNYIRQILQQTADDNLISVIDRSVEPVRTIGAVPISFEGNLLGIIKFTSGHILTDEQEQTITRFSKLAATALAKKKNEMDLQASQDFNKGILASLTSEIAVVDQNGIIIGVNDAWKNFSLLNGEHDLRHTATGASYFGVCEKAIANGDLYAQEALAGLKAVLNKEKTFFEMEYPCDSTDEKRWFIMSIASYGSEQVHAVVRHDNISKRKRAELELIESQNLIQKIYESSQDAVVIIDETGHITMWDSKSEVLFGWEQTEVLGELFATLVLPEPRRERHYQWLEKFRKTGEVEHLGSSLEIKVLKKGGNVIDVSLNLTYTKLDGKHHFIGFYRDISARKMAEEQLKDSEERYKSLFEKNLAGVYRASLDNYILDCNDSFAHILGQNSAADVIGKHVRELYVNLTHSDFVKEVRENNSKIVGHESLIVTTGGKMVYLLENATLILNDNGKPPVMEGTLIDITDRKEAEKALFKNKQRYKSLLDNMNDGFLVDDTAGKVTFANQRFCDIFGLQKSDLEKLQLEDYVAPDYREPLRERHNRRMNGEAVPDYFEYEGIRKDGSRVMLEVRVNKIFESGVLKGTQSVIRDITEKKRQEKEFVKLADLNREIIESSDELFYVIELKNLDANNNPATYISGKAVNFYGYTEEELIASPSLWYEALHPDDVKLVLDSNAQLYGTRKSVSRIYRSRNAKTGEYLWLLDFIKPVLNEAGEIHMLYGSIKNITELKIKEAELNKTASELNDRYNELMQFNYIVSHNLRTPIADIKGLSEIMTMPGISDADKASVIQNIRVSINKMDDLIKDLNVILATRSALNTKKTNVQIKGLLSSISDTLEKQIIDTGTVIVTEIDEGAAEIFSIKSYIESIFYNLISNAIKYRSPHRKPEIRVRIRKSHDAIVLTFADNGIGIDLTRYADKVFGLYKRFHREVEGKGIGLHMTKTQIEALGGKITVKSELNVGSVFTIVLPVY